MGKAGESDNEGGSGTQLCAQSKKRKRQVISQGSVNPAVEEVGRHEKVEVAPSNDGDQGTQSWFAEGVGGGGDVESVLEWFGEDGGMNGGESLKLWGVEDGFGLGICGSSKSAHGVEAVECKGSKPWFGEDGLFGNLGGAEIQMGGSAAVAFGNGGMGLSDVPIQDLFGGANVGLNVVGEGIQRLTGEAGHSNLDGKGMQGLFEKIACGNGSQIQFSGQGKQGQDGCFGNAGTHQDSKNGGGRVKGKRGRPKGSKNKKKIVGAEQSIEGLSDGKVKKQGRPKGSKKMKKCLSGECNKVGGDDVRRTEENLCQQKDSKDGMADVAVETTETVQLKPMRGRPKGSKNRKKKNLAAEQSIQGTGEVSGHGKVGTEIVCSMERQGPLKGSKKKNRPGENQDLSVHIVVDNNLGGDQTVRPMVLENERNYFLWKGYGVMPCEVAGGNEGGYDTGRRIEQDQQNGSKNEKKNSSGEVNDNVQFKIVPEENHVMSGKTVGGEGANEIQKGDNNAQQKKKRGRPKGSKNKQKRASDKKVGLSSDQQTVQSKDKQCFLAVSKDGTENNEGSDTREVPVLVMTASVREKDMVVSVEAITGGFEINSVVAEKGKGIPIEGSGANEGKNGPMVNHWCEEDLKKEPTVHAKEESHQNMEVICKHDDGNEGLMWRRGRPKGSKNKKKLYFSKDFERKSYRLCKYHAQITRGEGNNLKMGKRVSVKHLQGSLNVKRKVLTADIVDAQKKSRRKKSSTQSECSFSSVSPSITVFFILLMRFLKERLLF